MNAKYQTALEGAVRRWVSTVERTLSTWGDRSWDNIISDCDSLLMRCPRWSIKQLDAIMPTHYVAELRRLINADAEAQATDNEGEQLFWLQVRRDIRHRLRAEFGYWS